MYWVYYGVRSAGRRCKMKIKETPRGVSFCEVASGFEPE